MTCLNCLHDNPLADWKFATLECVSSSCSENEGLKYPDCGQRIGHIWLDGQKEWKESEFYKK